MPTPLNIKNPEAYRLASEIARLTGKTLTRVVVDALKHEQQRLKPVPEEIDMSKVRQILAELHAMPEVSGEADRKNPMVCIISFGSAPGLANGIVERHPSD